MLKKVQVAVVAGVLCVVASGSMVNAQTVDQTQQNSARAECIRNGGWYQQANGFCEYEATSKAALMEQDRTACERNGGWFHPDSGICEIESKDVKK